MFKNVTDMYKVHVETTKNNLINSSLHQFHQYRNIYLQLIILERELKV